MRSGEYLKKIRLEKNLSLRQVAYKTKLSHTFISEIEKGKLNGTVESQEKILNALEANVLQKAEFYKLSKIENLPEDIKTEMSIMEKKIIFLEKELNKDDIYIEHAINGDIYTVDSDENTKKFTLKETLYKEIDELNETQREKILKFIYDYIKV